MTIKNADLKTKKITQRDWTPEERTKHNEGVAKDLPTERDLAAQEIQQTNAKMAEVADEFIDLVASHIFLKDGVDLVGQLSQASKDVIAKRKAAKSKL